MTTDHATQDSSSRWGRETDLALQRFTISGEVVPTAIVHAIAMIKAEAARTNDELGRIPSEMAIAIERAANEITRGAFDDQFPIDVFQSGSGTNTNMNVNEVVASIAAEQLGAPVHPNDHVNASQSSNDVFPSAIRIAAAQTIRGQLVPALETLGVELARLVEQHQETVKLGRTHLMDAVPMTFGQEASAWQRAVHLGATRLHGVMPRLLELPLGGTAIGTGLNAPARFGELIAARIAARCSLPFVEAENHFEAQAAQDVLVELSGACKVVGMSLHKIAGDLRLLASGPEAGLGELARPGLLAGSSIMPGKVNPVICEAVQQVSAQVVGNDATITFGATASTLQLNTAMPVMARATMSSLSILAGAAEALGTHVLPGTVAHAVTMRKYAGSLSALVTVLAPFAGYDAAARIAQAVRSGSASLPEALAHEGVDVDLASIGLINPSSEG